MISIGFVIIALHVCVAALAFYNFYYKRRKLPPGPMPWPIIGNLRSVHAEPAGERVYARWAKEYGPIYTFWMGEQPIVVMTDVPQIIETFLKDGETFAGRHVFPETDKLLKGGTMGVVFTEGELWREHRRFALHIFRNLGVGKNLIQEKVLEEIAARFEKVDVQLEDNPKMDINLGQIFDVAVGSIINVIMFGYRFDRERESELFELKILIEAIFGQLGKMESDLLNLSPKLFSRLPYTRQAYLRIHNGYERLYDFYRRQIEVHRSEIDFDNLEGESTDYVEAFLKEAERRQRMGEKDHTYTMEQLVGMCFDLWTAGQETTSYTLTWGVAYILHNPHVQRKLHAELNAVIGNADRVITVADKHKLPYTNAVINEIQRTANLLPVNVLHRTTKDVTVEGFFLPRGTCIVPQISAVFVNDEYFPRPLEFDPDRFLTNDGQLKKCDELIPFGVGKRQCLGESLARVELFLFIANTFNKYKITDNGHLPSLKRPMRPLAASPLFACKMQKRSST